MMTPRILLGVCGAMIVASGSAAQLSAVRADPTSTDRTIDGARRGLLTGARGSLGPFEEAGDIPGCLLGETFGDSDGSKAENISLDGYVMPDGGEIEHLDNATLVNNLGAIASAGFEGPAGGPDPANERGLMLQFQRVEDQDPGVGVETAELMHNIYTSTDDRALFVSFDIYKHDHETFAWWRPVSYAEGLFAGGFIMGGVHETGLFAPLAAIRGDADLNEGVILLARRPTDNESVFFLGAKDAPENGWMTVGLLLTPDTMSVWLRDSETIAMDVRTPLRTTGAMAGTRMFSDLGFGLEEGWAQIYPGTEDDASTADIVEGFGMAIYEDIDGVFDEAQSFLDLNGDSVGPRWAARSIDASRFYVGSDQVDRPGYVRRNWWVDNYCVAGGERISNICAGDFNSDNAVDADDLANLLAAWGTGDADADLDQNGVVGSGDLARLLASWGDCG